MSEISNGSGREHFTSSEIEASPKLTGQLRGPEAARYSATPSMEGWWRRDVWLSNCRAYQQEQLDALYHWWTNT
jgi:hypothetical protein